MIKVEEEIKDLNEAEIIAEEDKNGKISLMVRNCPECNTTLQSYNNYFCSSCGFKLPDNLILEPKAHPFSVKKVGGMTEQVSKPDLGLGKITEEIKQVHVEKRTLVYGLVLVVLAAVFGVAVIKMDFLRSLIKPKSSNLLVQETNTALEPEYVNTVNLNLEASGKAVFKENINYVLYDADFFAEGSGLTNFVSFFEQSEDNKISPYLDKLNDHFYIFGIQREDGNWDLAFIFFEKEPIEDQFEIDEEQEWNLSKVQNALVLTNNAEFFDRIEKSAQNLVKNVSHRPQFSSYKAMLAKEGVFAYMNFLDTNEEVLSLLNSFGPSENLRKLILENQINDYNKFVIVNNDN